MQPDEDMAATHETTPRPDPTRATSTQLYREITAVRQIIETRLDAMDKTMERMQLRVDILEKDIGIAIKESCRHVRDVFEERFQSISVQMALHAKSNENSEKTVKEAVERAFNASESAVRAALDSAEKAVNEQNKNFLATTSKSEMSTSRQIEAIDATIRTTVNALNDKIDDIKSRLTTIEGSGKGSKDLMAIIFTIAGIAVAAIAAFIAFSKAG